MPRIIFIVCCIAMVVMAIAVNLMPVCLPLLAQGLGNGPLNKEQLGRIAAVTFIGVVLGLLVTGPMANRYSAKWFTAGGCLCVSAGLGLQGFAHTYNHVLLAVGVMGFGGGTLDMILSPIVCAIMPGNRTTSLNWLHSYFCVGAVLTVLAATLAFGHGMSWQTLALFFLWPPLLVGILFLFLPLPPLLTESQQRSRVRDLIRQKFFLLTLATIFLGGATEAAIAQWLPAFAELDLGFSRMTGGFSLLAFSLAMTLGRMIVGWLNHRVSIYQIMGWSCASTALLFLLAGLSPVPWFALGAAILAGFTGSCLWPSTLAIAADRYPSGGATMFGLLSALGCTGGIFMPWGVGVLADLSTLALGLAATAACPLLMLVTLRAISRQDSHPHLFPSPPTIAPEVLT